MYFVYGNFLIFFFKLKEIGTPEEDARRRDITINSLFFNIKTNQVEDFCGNGIEDLKNSFIRTPINPLITFRDDPLRILRVIRFAVRYQFTIDESILKAAQDPELNKIKRKQFIRKYPMKESQRN